MLVSTVYGGQSLASSWQDALSLQVQWELSRPFFVLLVQFIFAISGFNFILTIVIRHVVWKFGLHVTFLERRLEGCVGSRLERGEKVISWQLLLWLVI